MQQKRDVAYKTVNSLFDCVKPMGAFYLFPNVSSRLRENESAARFAERVLKEARVAVVPGEAFGVADHIRISYGVSTEVLTEGLERLTDVCLS